jgi:hypothetical protein
MSRAEEVSKLLKEISNSKYVTEVAKEKWEDCVGVECGHLYIQIFHRYLKAGNGIFFNENYITLCSLAELCTDDCVDRESKEYETQLLIDIR